MSETKLRCLSSRRVCMNDSTLGVHLKVQSRRIGEKVECVCIYEFSHIYLCVRWLHQTARASTLPIHNLICVSRRAAQPSYVITHTSNVEKQVLSLFKFHAHCARSYLAGFVNFTHQPSCSPFTKAAYFSQIMHY